MKKNPMSKRSLKEQKLAMLYQAVIIHNPETVNIFRFDGRFLYHSDSNDLLVAIVRNNIKQIEQILEKYNYHRSQWQDKEFISIRYDSFCLFYAPYIGSVCFIIENGVVKFDERI